MMPWTVIAVRALIDGIHTSGVRVARTPFQQVQAMRQPPWRCLS